MKKLIWLFAAIATLSLTAAVSAVLLSAQETSKSKTKTLTFAQTLKERTTPVTTGLASPVKLCSGILDSRWRDTIVVPDTFTIGACQKFAADIGTDQYQLGCMDANSISWGTYNNATPPPGNSCRW